MVTTMVMDTVMGTVMVMDTVTGAMDMEAMALMVKRSKQKRRQIRKAKKPNWLVPQ